MATNSESFENVLKRKVNLDVLDAKKKEARMLRSKERRKQLKASTKVRFINPENLIMRKRKEDRQKIRFARVAKDSGRFSKELKSVNKRDAQVALAIRIRGINGINPHLRRIFNKFNLNAKYSGAFIRLNDENVKLLKLIEPYITWGKTISDLLFKQGHLRIEGARVPITDNVLVEKTFGTLGIICVEDLIHEIYTASDNLSVISRNIWSFKLNPPAGKFPNKRVPFSKGGEVGLREEKINDLVQKMI